MNNQNSANSLFNTIKAIVDNYLNNRNVACIVVGTYNGSAIIVNEKLPLPMSMISGELKGQLVSGDKVRLLRNDGGREYYILEIIGKPIALKQDIE